MRNGLLILLAAALGGFGSPACSRKNLHAGDDGAGGGQAGTGGGQAGTSGGHAGTGGGQAGTGGGQAGTGGGPAGTGGGQAGGPAGAGGGQAGSTAGAGGGGTGGSAGAIGGDLSVNPSSATFASTLVEATSAAQTFTVRNAGNGPAAPAAAFEGTNAADYLITSNGCGTTLQPGASCQIAVAFAPKTRSGSRTASLAVSAPTGVPARVSLNGTALPSLGLLAGAPGPVETMPNWADVFHSPQALALDGAGSLYVADPTFHTIRKVVIATGAFTILAGGSTTAAAGADGIGAAASFSEPGGIASDGAGNLYVTDNYNHTIRKVVIATGAVTTLAGTAGQFGGGDGAGAAARFSNPNGIVYDGAGNLFVTELGNCTVRKIVIATRAVTTVAGTAGARAMGVDGIGAAARFTSPSAIASDGAGNLYVSDAGDNGTIRKIVIATGAVTTFAGTPGQHGTADGTGPDARFVAPWGIVSDGAGNLYLSDGSGSVRKIVIATRAVTTPVGTADGGGYADLTGTAARFSGPAGLVIDGAGNLYVADPGNNAIRKVAIATGVVTTFAGAPERTSVDGTGANARFTYPWGIAGDGAGNLYVTEWNNTIRKIVIATRAVTTLAGAQGQRANVDGTGLAARFWAPYGITGDGASNLYVVDGGVIRKVALATGAVTTIAGLASSTSVLPPFTGPTGIVNDGPDTLYVSDAIAIRKLALATGTLTTLAAVPGRSPEDLLPIGLASDGAGNLYFPNFGRIQKMVIATGAVSILAGGSNGSTDGPGATAAFNNPSGVASDGAGNLYVADTNNHTIRKIDLATGNVTTVIGSPDRTGVSLGALPASLSYPYSVAVLPTGELAIVDNTDSVVLIGHL